MWPDAIRSAAACALWATGILLKSLYMIYRWLYRSFRMLLAGSPAHQLCQAVEAVETVEAVEDPTAALYKPPWRSRAPQVPCAGV